MFLIEFYQDLLTEPKPKTKQTQFIHTKQTITFIHFHNFKSTVANHGNTQTYHTSAWRSVFNVIYRRQQTDKNKIPILIPLQSVSFHFFFQFFLPRSKFLILVSL